MTFFLSRKTCNSLPFLHHISFVHILSLLMPANSCHGDGEVLGGVWLQMLEEVNTQTQTKGRMRKLIKGCIHWISVWRWLENARSLHVANPDIIAALRNYNLCTHITDQLIVSILFHRVCVCSFMPLCIQGIFCVWPCPQFFPPVTITRPLIWRSILIYHPLTVHNILRHRI